MRAPRRRSSGAAAVEFALVLPLFLAVVFGMLEYGWYFYQQFGVSTAVREGARAGAPINQKANPDPRETAKKRVKLVLDNVGISYSGGIIDAVYSGVFPDRTLVVSAALTYTPLLNVMPTPSKLSYKLTMLLELQDSSNPP